MHPLTADEIERGVDLCAKLNVETVVPTDETPIPDPHQEAVEHLVYVKYFVNQISVNSVHRLDMEPNLHQEVMASPDADQWKAVE